MVGIPVSVFMKKIFGCGRMYRAGSPGLGHIWLGTMSDKSEHIGQPLRLV
jgi:hypothetical protein